MANKKADRPFHGAGQDDGILKERLAQSPAEVMTEADVAKLMKGQAFASTLREGLMTSQLSSAKDVETVGDEELGRLLQGPEFATAFREALVTASLASRENVTRLNAKEHAKELASLMCTPAFRDSLASVTPKAPTP